jgi:hypothetical protein
MENQQKTKSIIRASKIDLDHCDILLCDADDFEDAIEKLYQLEWEADQKYLFNLTCGTKIMALAAWQMATAVDQCRVIYWPIRADIFNVLLDKGDTEVFNNYAIENAKITLKEAMLAQDIIFEKSLAPSEGSYENTKQVMRRLLKTGDSRKVNEIKKAQHRNYKGSDKLYWTGGWFEEFLYWYFREKYQLESDYIAHGIKLYYNERTPESTSDNEIDVAFLLGDELHIVEAKVYNQAKINRAGVDNINLAVSKLANIADKFGLKAKFYVAMPARLNLDKNGYPSDKKKERINTIIQYSVIQEVLDYNYFKKLNL